MQIFATEISGENFSVPRYIVDYNHAALIELWQNDFIKLTAEDCYSPNRQGVLGQVPGHRRLLLATGWGGTAFKFALEVGYRVARIVERDITERRQIYA